MYIINSRINGGMRVPLLISNFLFLFFLTTSASAENLLEVYELALSNDATLMAAQFEYEAAREAIPQARAGLLPDVSVRLQYTKVRQDIRRTESPAIPEGKSSYPNENHSVSLNQPIVDVSSWVRFSQAKISVKKAETAFRGAQQELIMQVAEAYFGALQAQDRLEYARVEKTALGKQLQDVKMRNKAGTARISDVHVAEARYALSESKEIEAQNQLDDSYEALREHTRVFVLEVSPLKADIPFIGLEGKDVKEWIDDAIAQNLDLQASRLSLEVARKEAKFYETNHLPTLDLVVSHNRAVTGGASFSSTEGVVDSTNYMVQFNMPIYQGGGVQSRVRQAYNNRAKAVQEVEAQQRRIIRETRAAYRKVLSGIKKVQALKHSIISQQSALDVKSKGLKAGVNTLLEVLDAQRELYYAQTDYSQSRYDYLLATLKLRQATGSLTETDLQEINDLVN